MTGRWTFLFLAAVAAVGLVFVGLDVGAEDEAGDETEGFVTVEVATVGVDPLTGMPVLLLRELDGEARFLTMSIGPNEAFAIGRALFGMEVPRPMTHDLMQSLLEAADFEMNRVVVDDLRDNTYYATIHGRRGKNGDRVSVDSRPSDAIALAVRSVSPILVAERLLVGLEAPPESPIDPGQLFHVSGLTVATASPADLRQSELDAEAGALRVVAVHDALRDRLQVGDLVLEAGGKKVAQPADLMRVLRENRGVESIQLRIRRATGELEVDLPVSPEPRRDAAPGESPITA